MQGGVSFAGSTQRCLSGLNGADSTSDYDAEHLGDTDLFHLPLRHAAMSKSASALASESKQYASKAKDLHTQVSLCFSLTHVLRDAIHNLLLGAHSMHASCSQHAVAASIS